MELVIVIILSLAVGALCSGIVVYLLQAGKWHELNGRLIAAESDLGRTKSDLAQAEERAEVRCKDMQEQCSRDIASQKENYEARVAELKAQHERELKNYDEQFKLTLESAKEQMKGQFEEETKRRSEQLKQDNAERMSAVILPLKEELDRLRTLVNETKEKNDKSTSALEKSIEMMIQNDRERDKTTQDLANALKNRGKVHGDWGEQVLSDILRDSGLREGVEYFLQQNEKSEDGANLRPDVIVKAPDGSTIVIDSKVSLTAYTDYVGAEKEEERAKAVKENYASIWGHVVELAQKDYSKVVENSVPYVLMFVPNEGGYLLALNKDQSLLRNAYKKNVIIVNPTNLMFTLKLILLTWHNARQEENCAKILKEADAIFEKYVAFSKSYEIIGKHIKDADKAYQTALGQLSEGKGNLSRRIDNLRQLGVQSANRISKTIMPEIEDEN